MKKFLQLIIIMVCSMNLVTAQTSATYNAGDISTSLGAYDATCNGPLATLVINIPPGDYVTRGRRVL